MPALIKPVGSSSTPNFLALENDSFAENQAMHTPDVQYEWKVDLTKTEPFWKGRANKRIHFYVSFFFFFACLFYHFKLTLLLFYTQCFFLFTLEWFTGLSDKFLNARCSKLLILAGIYGFIFMDL